MKTCNKCNQQKASDQFHKKIASPDGHAKTCKDCHRSYNNARSKIYYNANKEKTKDSALNRKFGITLVQYNKMLNDQNNLCAICFESEDIKRKLAVDHCHETGKIRGLLCLKCNTGIGKLRDSEQLLLRAAKYVSAKR